jgi:hypothetical protein
MRRSRERERSWSSVQRNRSNRKLALGLGLAVLLVAGIALIPTVAAAEQEPATSDHSAHAAGLQDELAQVRRVTARFHRLDAALAAGYELGWVNGSGVRIITGCISSPTGAMGYHYFNPQLMADNAVDALEPEALVYAPAPDGDGLKLAAVEYVVRGPATNPPGPSQAPSVLGMEMHILNPVVGFWLMHAWVWATNPAGIFEDWNPEVSCS